MSETTADSAALSRFRLNVDRFAAAFNEGDFERASAGFADDVEQHFPDGFPQRFVQGRDAWVEFFAEFRTDMEEWRMTPRESLQVAPRSFVAGFRYTGVGRTSRIPLTIDVWNLIELDREGRTRRILDFSDRDKAIASGRERAA